MSANVYNDILTFNAMNGKDIEEYVFWDYPKLLFSEVFQLLHGSLYHLKNEKNMNCR